MQKIIVDIDHAGEVKIKVEGCSGPGCQRLTQAIEASLGKTTADVKTGEFYQQQKQTAQAGSGQ